MQDEDGVDDDDRARKDAALECLKHLFTSCVAPESLEDFRHPSGIHLTLFNMYGVETSWR